MFPFNPLILIKGGALVQICGRYGHHRPAKFLFLDLTRLPRAPAPLMLTHHQHHISQNRAPMYIALSEDPGELSNEYPPADALRDHPFTEKVEIK